MNCMGHVTNFLLISRNNSLPHEKRYRIEIFGKIINVINVMSLNKGQQGTFVLFKI